MQIILIAQGGSRQSYACSAQDDIKGEVQSDSIVSSLVKGFQSKEINLKQFFELFDWNLI